MDEDEEEEDALDPHFHFPSLRRPAWPSGRCSAPGGWGHRKCRQTNAGAKKNQILKPPTSCLTSSLKSWSHCTKIPGNQTWFLLEHSPIYRWFSQRTKPPEIAAWRDSKSLKNVWWDRRVSHPINYINWWFSIFHIYIYRDREIDR